MPLGMNYNSIRIYHRFTVAINGMSNCWKKGIDVQ